MPVVLMNMNSYNIWIRQPLLAADLVEVEHYPWDYQPSMSREGDEVTVSFHPVAFPRGNRQDILSSAVNSTLDNDNDTDETSKRTTFGPQPDFNDSDLDFAKELDCIFLFP